MSLSRSTDCVLPDGMEEEERVSARAAWRQILSTLSGRSGRARGAASVATVEQRPQLRSDGGRPHSHPGVVSASTAPAPQKHIRRRNGRCSRSRRSSGKFLTDKTSLQIEFMLRSPKLISNGERSFPTRAVTGSL